MKIEVKGRNDAGELVVTLDSLDELKSIYENVHLSAVSHIDDLELREDSEGREEELEEWKARRIDFYEYAEQMILHLIDQEIARIQEETK